MTKITSPAPGTFVRATFPGPTFARSESEPVGVMTGRLAVFDEWTEINSRVEGHFMERVAPGAFKKTFQEGRGRIRSIFNHGIDPSIGLKPLGQFLELREDDDEGAAVYAVQLLDADYTRELVPGLEAGVYGSSFRMRPGTLKVEVVRPSRSTSHNPSRLPEHTIRETGVIECGPVTFQAYHGSTAGMRSLTDQFEIATKNDDGLWHPGASISVPADVEADEDPVRAELIEDGLYARCADTVSSEPWLITPEAYATIKSILHARREGAKLSREEIAGRIEGLQRDAPSSPQGNVAVIPLYGPIVPRATYFTQVSGVASVEGFQKAFREALDSNDVSAIVIDINSPGGQASMIEELGNEILAARDVKPVVGVANTLAASAAYWVMACCSEAVSTLSGHVGSVGACADHTDLTAAMAKQGVNVTQFSSAVSPFKLELSPFRALSKDAIEHAQASLDKLGEKFVAVVAHGRGVTTEKVLADFGQGRVLDAEEALAAGMIDRIATIEETVARLGSDAEELDSTEGDADAPLPVDEENDDESDTDDPDVDADEALHGAAVGHSANGAELAHSGAGSRSSEPAAAASTTPDERTTPMGKALEDKKGRVAEINTRLKELNIEHSSGQMPDAARVEWDELRAERTGIESDISDVEGRLEQLREMGLSDDTPAQPRRIKQNGREGGFSSGVRAIEDPYDLTTIRANQFDPEALSGELRERALRAVDGARFRQPNVSQEDAQTSAERLLDEVETTDGSLARHMLATGSDTYRRAFGKSLAGIGLTRSEEDAMRYARAASLTNGQGGYAVPFTLDPTVILTSDGATNPIRAIARVGQTVTDNWNGITSAGVVAAYRNGEATEADDNAPTLQQPSIPVQEADVFIPYSYAIGQDWVGMGADFAMMIADAKDVLEAEKFLHGAGSGSKEPEGIISGLDPSSWVETSAHTFAPADVYDVEAALPARFRSKAQWIAARGIYNKIRQFDTAGGAQMWMRINQLLENTPAGNTGAQVLGYAANEASEMDETVVDGALILLLGDFRNFIVVDRIGMSIEAIPNLFGPNGRPTGQRGLYAYWRNSSAVLVDNAFRLLRVSPS